MQRQGMGDAKGGQNTVKSGRIGSGKHGYLVRQDRTAEIAIAHEKGIDPAIGGRKPSPALIKGRVSAQYGGLNLYMRHQAPDLGRKIDERLVVARPASLPMGDKQNAMLGGAWSCLDMGCTPGCRKYGWLHEDLFIPGCP